MSDYEATAYLSLEKLKVSYDELNFSRRNICWNFSSFKKESETNYDKE